jgi:hypothetical protein
MAAKMPRRTRYDRNKNPASHRIIRAVAKSAVDERHPG